MSKQGGAREGAGRKAGSLNRRTSEILAGAAEGGKLPVEYLLEVMRDEQADQKRRDWAAEKAAAFIHPRPSPLDRTVKLEGLPSTSTIAGIDQALDRIIAAIADEQLAPSEGQALVTIIETRRKAIETGDVMDRLQRLEEQISNR